MAKGIFEGVRIVELAQYVFVPGGSVLLADQGAEVIHVEPTGSGDPYRTLRVGDGRELGDINLAMEQNNRNKKSIAIDLKHPDGHEAMLALIRTADIFLTSLRPKAIRKLGLDVENLRAVNPQLIYARGNGFGFAGPDADRPGFDSSAFWARSGMADAFSPPGQPMTPPRASFGDHSSSISLAFGLASALYERERTGEPSVVETSLLGTALWMLSSDVTYSQSPGYQVHSANPNRFPLMSAYRTRDGRRIQLMLLDPQPKWPGLCHLIGRPELLSDPRFVDNSTRMKFGGDLVDIIQAEIGARDWQAWKPGFEAWDAPWELIQTVPEISSDPQVIANEMIFSLAVSGEAQVQVVAGPVSFPGRPDLKNRQCSPRMGEHTDQLLSDAGYDAGRIETLRLNGIVQ